MALQADLPAAPTPAPYTTLAPYFAQLFRPSGIRGWFRRGQALVGAAGVHGGLHLDVGAGTCRYSRYWLRAGFRTVCLDLLHAMLARAKLAGTEGRLHRVCGTLDCLRPGAGFDLVTAIDDVVAYVGAQPGGLDGFVARLGPRMRPGGVVLFDFITPAGRRRYTFRNSRRIPEGVITADSRGLFDERTRTLTVDLVLTTPVGVARERHVMRLHEPAEIETCLRRAGFEVLALTDLYEDGVGYQAGLPSYDLLARRL